MSNDNSLVSIITPMYKGARFVVDTINSVLNQDYLNWEMIIVDDCSPDNGAGIKIVKSFVEKDDRIRLIKLNRNRGSSGARNVGINNANGRYICLLDSDDFWDSTFLSSQYDFLTKKDAALVYSSYRRVDEDGKKEIFSPVIVHEKVNYRKYLMTYEIGCLTVLYDTKKIGKRYLNEGQGSIRDDTALWLSILKDIDCFYGNPKILATYRVVNGSATNNKMKLIRPQWKLYREIERLSFLTSCFYFLCWSISGCLKYRKL